VANLSGKGVVNGVWVNTIVEQEWAITQDWGVEIILDGVDRTPPGWSHRIVYPVRSNVNRSIMCTTPAIGGVLPIREAESSRNDYINSYLRDIMIPASAPVPFNSSLVVNFIHKETSSTNEGSRCYVNAWLTE
jgi:hypothetical protein